MSDSKPHVLVEASDFLVIAKPAFWTCELISPSTEQQQQQQQVPNTVGTTTAAGNATTAFSRGAAQAQPASSSTSTRKNISSTTTTTNQANAYASTSTNINKSVANWLQANRANFSIDQNLFAISANQAISGDTGFGPLCHRLDRETSGPMLVGKTKKAREKIRDLFHKQKVAKHYLCLVHGKVTDLRGSLQFPIRTVRSNASTWSEVASTKDAEPARTDFVLVGWFREKLSGEVGKEEDAEITGRAPGVKNKPGSTTSTPEQDEEVSFHHASATSSSTPASRRYFSLLACSIHSGRTHQIRVHLQHIGHPLVCDDKYRWKKITSEDGPSSWKNKGSSSSNSSAAPSTTTAWPAAAGTRLTRDPPPAAAKNEGVSLKGGGRGDESYYLSRHFCPRLFLHSYLLGFELDQKRFEVVAPLPAQLKKFLVDKLELVQDFTARSSEMLNETGMLPEEQRAASAKRERGHQKEQTTPVLFQGGSIVFFLQQGRDAGRPQLQQGDIAVTTPPPRPARPVFWQEELLEEAQPFYYLQRKVVELLLEERQKRSRSGMNRASKPTELKIMEQEDVGISSIAKTSAGGTAPSIAENVKVSTSRLAKRKEHDGALLLSEINARLRSEISIFFHHTRSALPEEFFTGKAVNAKTSTDESEDLYLHAPFLLSKKISNALTSFWRGAGVEYEFVSLSPSTPGAVVQDPLADEASIKSRRAQIIEPPGEDAKKEAEQANKNPRTTTSPPVASTSPKDEEEDDHDVHDLLVFLNTKSKEVHASELEGIQERKRVAIQNEDYVLAASLKAMETQLLEKTKSVLTGGNNMKNAAGATSASKIHNTVAANTREVEGAFSDTMREDIFFKSGELFEGGASSTASIGPSKMDHPGRGSPFEVRTVVGDIHKRPMRASMPDRDDFEAFPALGGASVVKTPATSIAGAKKKGTTSANSQGGREVVVALNKTSPGWDLSAVPRVAAADLAPIEIQHAAKDKEKELNATKNKVGSPALFNPSNRIPNVEGHDPAFVERTELVVQRENDGEITTIGGTSVQGGKDLPGAAPASVSTRASQHAAERTQKGEEMAETKTLLSGTRTGERDMKNPVSTAPHNQGGEEEMKRPRAADLVILQSARENGYGTKPILAYKPADSAGIAQLPRSRDGKKTNNNTNGTTTTKTAAISASTGGTASKNGLMSTSKQTTSQNLNWPLLFQNRMDQARKRTVTVAELADLVPEFAEKMQHPKKLELEALLLTFYPLLQKYLYVVLMNVLELVPLAVLHDKKSKGYLPEKSALFALFENICICNSNFWHYVEDTFAIYTFLKAQSDRFSISEVKTGGRGAVLSG
ncbi:unnamed protein product [Amoebophrya sp. A120]|nr:unnamed protein product [Amoebophrya sp. A120]|eukprot:GSA120T00014717001.1